MMTMRMRTQTLSLTLALLLLAASSASALVRYVKTDGLSIGPCLTWATACTLPTALGLADPLAGDQVWVKSGTYAPFSLVNGVRIIGGFSGTETTASQSNPTTNVSIIDGGLNAPCVTNVNTSPTAPAAILRGFTLRNGRDSGDEGGGAFLENSGALFVQCLFEENSAKYFGGAVAIRGAGSPQFINCVFRKNGAAAANPRDNLAGGAVYVREGTPLFVNCLFENNKAGQGGIVFLGDGSPTFINCTMVKNESTLRPGGAISDPNGQVTLKNCILWDNKRWVDDDGPGGPNPPVSQADQISGASLALYCDTRDSWGRPEDGNINADPLFINSANGDYRLQESPASPCRDSGNENLAPPDTGDLNWNNNTIEPVPFDLAGLPRFGGNTVDIGAYEILPPPEQGGPE